jgi:hypothetical protein
VEKEMSTEQPSLKYWIIGWYILFKGKLRGKSNYEIISEWAAQYKLRTHGDRIFNAKLDDEIERMIRGEEQ